MPDKTLAANGMGGGLPAHGCCWSTAYVIVGIVRLTASGMSGQRFVMTLVRV